MVNRKRLILLTAGFLVLVMTAGTAWAIVVNEYKNFYNRPVPLMDYTPQEIGFYDTKYPYLGEDDCRACHSNSLADRHHYTDIVLQQRLCTPCHEIIPDPPGVVVIRDCTTSGCHSWPVDVLAPPTGNGWHHNTDLSASENCVACHDRNLIAEILPEAPPPPSFPPGYDPSLVTPTPYSCENCHWGEEVVNFGWSPGDAAPAPAAAGHPSDYQHYDPWGGLVGYWEYGKPIFGTSATHEMEFVGNVATDCAVCHSLNPNNPDWEYDNPELIRYCEICHDIGSLHTLGRGSDKYGAASPHVGPVGTAGGPAADGWEAVGFHTTGGPQPDTYRTFEANEQCFGCHGDAVPAWDDDVTCAPVIDAADQSFSPNVGCEGTIITIRGDCFGDEHMPGRYVEMFPTGLPGSAKLLPIYSWTNELIEAQVPNWEFDPGNWKVRVNNGFAPSGKRNFTLLDCESPVAISPDSGPCYETIVLTRALGGFRVNTGTFFSETIDNTGYDALMLDKYHGVRAIVDFSASQGDYTSLNVIAWKDTKITVKFKNFYEDDHPRDYEQTTEDTVLQCIGMATGVWDVYVRYIFYGDDNDNDQYDNGDTIFQIVSSTLQPVDPPAPAITYTLTNDPLITGRSPKKIDPNMKLKVYGINFGAEQNGSTLHIGGTALTSASAKIRMWSNTKIKVKIPNYVAPFPKFKDVWVTVNGVDSNKTVIKVLQPLP